MHFRCRVDIQHGVVQQTNGDLHPAHRHLQFRWSTLAVALAAATASVVLLSTLVTLWAPHIGLLVGGADFAVYREGARHVFDDLPLYAKPMGYWKLWYIYPPFSALVFAPFVWWPDHADVQIWFAVNVVLLIAIVVMCFRTLGYRITPYLVGISALLAIACGFLEPVRITLFYGQINLLLMLLVLWDVSRGQRSRFKGIGIGLAAGIKMTPAYFVLYYLLVRQWRAAGVAVATIAATIGLGWLVLPNDSGQYWDGRFSDSSRMSKSLFHVGNQSLHGAIARLTGKVPPTWLWLGADACVVVISMWIAVRLYHRGESLLAVTVVGLSATAVSPFAWTHHWVWLVAMVVYLVHRSLTNRWWWIGVIALFAVMGSWAHSFPGDRWPRVGLFLLLPKWAHMPALVNLHLIVYAVLLVVAAVIASLRKDVPKDPEQAGQPPEQPARAAITVGS